LRSEEIARQLNVAKITVDFRISNAKNKLQANTREQAAAIVVGSGLIKLLDCFRVSVLPNGAISPQSLHLPMTRVADR
jgi:hypothetical protein